MKIAVDFELYAMLRRANALYMNTIVRYLHIYYVSLCRMFSTTTLGRFHLSSRTLRRERAISDGCYDFFVFFSDDC